jgi:hypothetical protein
MTPLPSLARAEAFARSPPKTRPNGSLCDLAARRGSGGPPRTDPSCRYPKRTSSREPVRPRRPQGGVRGVSPRQPHRLPAFVAELQLLLARFARAPASPIACPLPPQKSPFFSLACFADASFCDPGPPQRGIVFALNVPARSLASLACDARWRSPACRRRSPAPPPRLRALLPFWSGAESGAGWSMDAHSRS